MICEPAAAAAAAAPPAGLAAGVAAGTKIGAVAGAGTKIGAAAGAGTKIGTGEGDGEARTARKHINRSVCSHCPCMVATYTVPRDNANDTSWQLGLRSNIYYFQDSISMRVLKEWDRIRSLTRRAGKEYWRRRR